MIYNKINKIIFSYLLIWAIARLVSGRYISGTEDEAENHALLTHIQKYSRLPVPSRRPRLPSQLFHQR